MTTKSLPGLTTTCGTVNLTCGCPPPARATPLDVPANASAASAAIGFALAIMAAPPCPSAVPETGARRESLAAQTETASLLGRRESCQGSAETPCGCGPHVIHQTRPGSTMCH